ncbi:MAG: hypothetical protein Kow00121_05340 [Elainellaceae cyanobacterium]
MAITPFQPAGFLNPLFEEDQQISYAYALGKSVNFLVRLLWFLALLVLLAVSLLVWVWLASFRSGWNFWTWAADQTEQPTLALNLVYGFIIALISPFAIFLNWSQKQITDWLNIPFPPKVNLCQIIEQQLGIGKSETSSAVSKQAIEGVEKK